MKLFNLPVCPYCNKKMNFIASWALRREGEFRCPRCRGISNIMLDIKIVYFASAAVILSALLFIILRLICKIESVAVLLLTVFPIIVFYIMSVFYVKLKKPVTKKRRRQQTKISEEKIDDQWAHTSEIERTKIL